MTTTNSLGLACPAWCNGDHSMQGCHFSDGATFGDFRVEVARDPTTDTPTVFYLVEPEAEPLAATIFEGDVIERARGIVQALQWARRTARTTYADHSPMNAALDLSSQIEQGLESVLDSAQIRDECRRDILYETLTYLSAALQAERRR
jgi:hypothetical protein